MRKVTKIKIKYYSKETLKYLLLAGVIYIAASNPHFSLRIAKNLLKIRKDLSKEKARRSFNYLKNRGLVEIKKDGHDVIITLTKEGKKMAEKYQINDLEIERPKKWDGRYRLVIFDIPNSTGFIRNVLRRKLKEWGFYFLQRSVWVHAFDCKEEVKLLKEFLGLSKNMFSFWKLAE